MPSTQTHLDFEAQAENLERVSLRIATAILRFATYHQGREFHMEAMRHHVTTTVGHVAPGSPDRILRQLRQAGRLRYRVVNRRQSLYQITEVNS